MTSTGQSVVETIPSIVPYKRTTHAKTGTVKYTYMEEYTKTIKETSKVQGQPGETVTTKEITEWKEKSVILKKFAQSMDEDVEDLFELILQLIQELPWATISAAKGNEATILFQAMDHCLISTALANWKTVVGEEKSRTWETYKILLAAFICTKVLSEDAYDIQVAYMQTRLKPSFLSFKEWLLRLQTMNRYLPFMYATLKDLKSRDSTCIWTDWFVKGGLSDTQIKDIIIQRMPKVYWNRFVITGKDHEARRTWTAQRICEQCDRWNDLTQSIYETYDMYQQQPYDELNEFEIEYQWQPRWQPSLMRQQPRSYGSMNPQQQQGRAMLPITYSTGTAYEQHNNNLNQQQLEFQPQSQRYYTGRSNGQWINHGGARSHGGASLQSNSEQQATMRPNQQLIQSGVYFQQQQHAPAMEQESLEVETVDDGQMDQYATMEETLNAWNSQFFIDDVAE